MLARDPRQALTGGTARDCVWPPVNDPLTSSASPAVPEQLEVKVETEATHLEHPSAIRIVAKADKSDFMDELI